MHARELSVTYTYTLKHTANARCSATREQMVTHPQNSSPNAKLCLAITVSNVYTVNVSPTASNRCTINSLPPREIWLHKIRCFENDRINLILLERLLYWVRTEKCKAISFCEVGGVLPDRCSGRQHKTLSHARYVGGGTANAGFGIYDGTHGWSENRCLEVVWAAAATAALLGFLWLGRLGDAQTSVDDWCRALALLLASSEATTGSRLGGFG